MSELGHESIHGWIEAREDRSMKASELSPSGIESEYEDARISMTLGICQDIERFGHVAWRIVLSYHGPLTSDHNGWNVHRRHTW
eukprot:4464864-Pyramimonas_sp.AAC.1